MSSTLVMLYLIVAIGTAISLYVESGHLDGGTQSPTLRATLSAVAGVLWPILLVRVVELGAVVLYGKADHVEEFSETWFDSAV